MIYAVASTDSLQNTQKHGALIFSCAMYLAPDFSPFPTIISSYFKHFRDPLVIPDLTVVRTSISDAPTSKNEKKFSKKIPNFP